MSDIEERVAAFCNMVVARRAARVAHQAERERLWQVYCHASHRAFNAAYYAMPCAEQARQLMYRKLAAWKQESEVTP